ncbi:hypothetical protein PTSG_02933 [Salpingoeca rosetta]|uniref:Uncharacterized protein n=1 Tax=Salpingoeca rosetta (strain ATCC 50818 / BSB-021) TaxID=946362 RepID=F2U3R9_SALR5|nr:uncharacterized protein PTSG_02933 [Salpingoeca rosetta]EGD82263.1 hypothetical protein PTSG_02933 [Salpingoeca rosetta]|eukprot:XP_004996446.1 hypothetical protein PTSG_02933 [Salpingoeca rosetta]
MVHRFEATHVDTENAQLSKAPIQQVYKLAGRFVSGIVLLSAVFDKTRTLTVGSPKLARVLVGDDTWTEEDAL